MSYVATFNRRTFLKGAGALVALPFFESLGHSATEIPTRFCFMYAPNGMYMENWTPREIGQLAAGRLSPILKPFADHLNYITVISGLNNKVSEKTGRPETLGQHARSIGAFLSATYPTQDLRAGETIDVVLAKSLGGGFRIPLLNLATEYAADQHDVGYSEVYNYSLSWKDAATPIQPIESPRYAFELLCGESRTPGEVDSAVNERKASKKSILDAVMGATKSLQTKLNSSDRKGLDSYLESVRSVEKSIDATSAPPTPGTCPADREDGYEPRSFDEHIRLMLELTRLGLQAGNSRVVTMMLGAERSERDFGYLSPTAGMDMSGGHHSISHHKNKASQIKRYVHINTYYARLVSEFIQTLKETREGEGNLLDYTFMVYGSSMADGNSHEHSNIPLLIAGKGNGLIDPGKQGLHIDVGGRPVSNLYLTLLQKMAVSDPNGNPYSSFGDSSGILNLPGGH